MIRLIVGEKDAGQRLDKYLHRYMPLAGNGFLYKMLRKKNITLGGARADGSERLSCGDEICLYLSDETVRKFRSSAAEHLSFRPLDVLFENGDYLIVNKPSGILTQRDHSGENALSDDVLGYLMRNGSITEETLLHFRPSPANRLDRNTSGIVLFGKTLAGQQILAGLIRKRKIRKYYLTLVSGHFPGKIRKDAWLLKDRKNNTSKILSSPEEGAEEIRTVFTPSAYYGGREGNEDGWTLLEAELLTGKPHQIRAGLSSLGFPSAGDPKYGDPDCNRFLFEKYRLRSQLLHAYKIVFSDEDIVPDVFRGKTFTAPCPPAFERILKDLEYDKTK